MGKANKFDLTFLKKEEIAKGIYSFYFNRKDITFNFNSGQYLSINLDIKNPDERGSSRYFTISSSPTDKDFLTITTKIVKSSFKLKLNKLNPGEKIRAFGPIGYFDFDPKSKKQNIFISGGMGITPFHSTLRFIENKKIKSNITLLASFASLDEAIFFDELKDIEKRNKLIKIVYTLTKEKNPSINFEKGRIDELMIKKYIKKYKTAKYFIVGPLTMVDSMFELIKSFGISEENIFKEDFPGY